MGLELWKTKQSTCLSVQQAAQRQSFIIEYLSQSPHSYCTSERIHDAIFWLQDKYTNIFLDIQKINLNESQTSRNGLWLTPSWQTRPEEQCDVAWKPKGRYVLSLRVKGTQIEFQFAFSSLKGSSFSPFVIGGNEYKPLFFFLEGLKSSFLPLWITLSQPGFEVGPPGPLEFMTSESGRRDSNYSLGGFGAGWVCLCFQLLGFLAFQGAPSFRAPRLLAGETVPPRPHSRLLSREVWQLKTGPFGFFLCFPPHPHQFQMILKYQICQACNAVRMNQWSDGDILMEFSLKCPEWFLK